MEMKKIECFVGIFLVGFIMFGLVSGAGYNIVVPSTTPDGNDGSGGSGGGGATTNVTDNETVSSDEASEEGSAEKDVSEGDESVGEGVIEDIKDGSLGVWVLIIAVIIIVAGVVFWKKRIN